MSDVRVALLRGINVGRAKRVAMADLREVIEELGYRDARTLLNSGNAIFTVGPGAPAEPGPAIEHAITSRLGVSSSVTIVSATDMAAVVAANPLADLADNPSRLMIAFVREADGLARVEPLLDRDWGAAALALGPRVAYLWCPAGVIESALSKAVGRALGDRVTVRNWATVLKIEAAMRRPPRPSV